MLVVLNIIHIVKMIIDFLHYYYIKSLYYVYLDRKTK